jgi:hypothetical protein
MSAVRSAMRIAALAPIAAILACSGDPKAVGPAKPPSPTLLIGTYHCVHFLGYYQGSQGTGYYQGSCAAYVNVTKNPSRLDSIETKDFTINDRLEVTRPDFETGLFVYDSAASRATVNYSTGRQSQVFSVWGEGQNTLTQTFFPFDYNGDGLPDSLRLTFRKL